MEIYHYELNFVPLTAQGRPASCVLLLYERVLRWIAIEVLNISLASVFFTEYVQICGFCSLARQGRPSAVCAV